MPENVGQFSKSDRELSEYRGSLQGDYLQLFFQQLVGQFRTMAGTQSNAGAAYQEASTIVNTLRPDEVTWADAYRLELALLQVQPAEALRRQAWILRREFADVAGADRYAAYLASNPPDAQNAPDPELRADLEQLLREIQWLYTVLPVQERVRSTLARRTLALTAIALGGAVVLFFLHGIVRHLTGLAAEGPMLFRPDRNITSVSVVLAAGVVGGLISTLRRIQNTPLRDNVMVDLVEASKSSLSVFVSPLIGAVFALVLLMLFKGQLLSGELFPKFWTAQANNAPTTRPTAFLDLIDELTPDGAMNYAKLIVWAFIAGFAEQLVPDALSRLAEGAKPSQASRGAPRSG